MNPSMDNPSGPGLPPAGAPPNAPGPSLTPQYDTTMHAHSQQLVDGSQDDVLFKQTVAQAQQIITQTAQDPYIQVRELEKLKAVYLNKRFGKDIKVAKN